MSKQRDERSSKDWTAHRHRMARLTSLARVDGDALPAAADELTGRLSADVLALRAELRALPDAPAPEDIWREVQRRLDRVAPPVQRAASKRWLGVAAAAALVATVVGAFVMKPAPRSVATTDAARDATVHRLVAESQRLERDLRRRSAPRFAIDSDEHGALQSTASRRALIYRLADIDDELTTESLAPAADQVRMAQLWRQRVELMESLGELERAEQWQAYRTVVF